MKISLKRVGNSTGIILPKELLAKLGLQEGDELYANLTAKGGLELSPFDPSFEESMRLAEEIIEEYKDTLRELAK
ncbi:MAG: AbrB/MazE/SpoVT family DNA-binding domain-containing protein [Beijerinckiaceae bacterium]